MIGKNIQSALTIGLGVAAFAATIPAAHAQEAEAAGLEEVFVTARKRDEGVQAVPISIAALSSDALSQHGVVEEQDLNTAVPGFRFGAQGGKGNTDVILRGLSKIPIGEGMPAVVTYFANVALPGRGGNIPMYDIANIQVLKGPQGTLFGRNTLGGAVVIAPVAPTYELGGYVKGAYGTADNRLLEGALNVPLVEEKVALRVSGQIRRQDGLSKNLSGGPDMQDTHQNSYRISLLAQPTDKIENTFVYDHLTAPEGPAPGYMFRTNPSLAAIESTFNSKLPGTNAGTQLATQINDYLAGQRQAGYHASYTDLPDGGYTRRNLWGISNDTSWDMGGATLRNIFGYRRVHSAESISSSDTGPIRLDLSALSFLSPAFTAETPFTLFNSQQVTDRKYISDEIQLFGTALDDRLDWITGYYFNKDESAEPNGTQFTAFSLGGVPTTPITANVYNKNWAVFAQGGLDISEWTLDGLKFNLGARYSVDDTSACGGPNAAGYMSSGECKDQAKLGAIGVGTGSTNDEEVSYTAGFDWQVSPDTLVYLTTRHGYRAANVNTPIFNTYYTTAGNGPLDAALGVPGSPTSQQGCADGGAAACPDLRPFQTTEPEKITDYEVGVKNDWSIGDVKGRVNAAAYITKYKNAVQFLNAQTAGIPGAYQPNSGSVGVNASDLTIKGVELDLTVIPVSSLTLSFSGAYTDQNVDKLTSPPTTGNIPALTKDTITLPSPKFSGTFAFSWVLPVQPLDGDLVFNGDYYHTDKFSGQNGENIPGYELANFRLSWNGVAKTKLDLAAFVKNAFDEEYFSSPIVLFPTFPMSVGIPGDPRTWGVEATYKF